MDRFPTEGHYSSESPIQRAIFTFSLSSRSSRWRQRRVNLTLRAHETYIDSGLVLLWTILQKGGAGVKPISPTYFSSVTETAAQGVDAENPVEIAIRTSAESCD